MNMQNSYKLGEHPDIPNQLKDSMLKKYRQFVGICDKEDDGCIAIFQPNLYTATNNGSLDYQIMEIDAFVIMCEGIYRFRKEIEQTFNNVPIENLTVLQICYAMNCGLCYNRRIVGFNTLII